MTDHAELIEEARAWVAAFEDGDLPSLIDADDLLTALLAALAAEKERADKADLQATVDRSALLAAEAREAALRVIIDWLAENMPRALELCPHKVTRTAGMEP